MFSTVLEAVFVNNDYLKYFPRAYKAGFEPKFFRFAPATNNKDERTTWTLNTHAAVLPRTQTLTC